jgi:hypothetical protein
MRELFPGRVASRRQARGARTAQDHRAMPRCGDARATRIALRASIGAVRRHACANAAMHRACRAQWRLRNAHRTVRSRHAPRAIATSHKRLRVAQAGLREICASRAVIACVVPMHSMPRPRVARKEKPAAFPPQVACFAKAGAVQ